MLLPTDSRLVVTKLSRDKPNGSLSIQRTRWPGPPPKNQSKIHQKAERQQRQGGTTPKTRPERGGIFSICERGKAEGSWCCCCHACVHRSFGEHGPTSPWLVRRGWCDAHLRISLTPLLQPLTEPFPVSIYVHIHVYWYIHVLKYLFSLHADKHASNATTRTIERAVTPLPYFFLLYLT